MEPARPIDILVVEDDVDIRDVLAEILTGEGYQLATAPDGQAALAQIAGTGLPRLIILDLMMPVMDGWIFRRELLARPGGARVPIIVLSGFADPTSAEMVGVRYLAKPVKMDNLLRLIAEQLSGVTRPAVAAYR